MRDRIKKDNWKSPIDRKIHFIWIGTNPQPDYFVLFLEKFKQLNPEFECRVWSDKDLTKSNFPLTYSYIKKAQKLHGKVIKEDGQVMYQLNGEPYKYNKYAQCTDLMRLEIVYRNSGYYFDTTFEPIKPLYKLFNVANKTFVSCNEVPRFKDFFALSNSFFGATKGNTILKRLLSKSKLDKIDFLATAVDFETGPVYLRSGIKDSDLQKVKIFPTDTFYPYVEEYVPGEDPPYRKSGPDRCHSDKKTKRATLKLKNNKGYLEWPCERWPAKTHCAKRWALGKSWVITDYYLGNPNDPSKEKGQLRIHGSSIMHKGRYQRGGVACIPCLANPVTAPIAIAGACTYGLYKGVKYAKNKYNRLTKNRSNKSKEETKSKKSDKKKDRSKQSKKKKSKKKQV